MPYRVRVGLVAQRQMDEFASYLADYSEDLAIEQFEPLDRILRINLGKAPLTWSYFPLTGKPYRAYLFRVGRRTHYWIIYTVDEERGLVDILRFWNASKDPLTFEF
jgi:hypothetical protein